MAIAWHLLVPSISCSFLPKTAEGLGELFQPLCSPLAGTELETVEIGLLLLVGALIKLRILRFVVI